MRRRDPPVDSERFRYQPKCSTPGCDRPALYKVAATWSDGTSRELKNYGTVCEEHRDELLARACAHRGTLKPAEGETLGPVGLYQLAPGRRDADLKRLAD
jgi:hypothetical protein